MAGSYDDLEEMVKTPADLDEKARAGMTGDESDQFIGFEKLLKGSSLGGQKALPAPNAAAMKRLAEVRAAHERMKRERQSRIDQAVVLGKAGAGQLPAFDYDAQGNIHGYRPARNILQHQYVLPNGVEILGIDQEKMQPGDLEYLIQKLTPYQR